jgi:hypothetical protein
MFFPQNFENQLNSMLSHSIRNFVRKNFLAKLIVLTLNMIRIDDLLRKNEIEKQNFVITTNFI